MAKTKVVFKFSQGRVVKHTDGRYYAWYCPENLHGSFLSKRSAIFWLQRLTVKAFLKTQNGEV